MARGGGRGGGGERRQGAGTEGGTDYGAIYAVADESNSRLRHWIADIYDLHGLPAPQLYRAPYAPLLHDTTPRALRLLLSTRCLVLELWSFQAILAYFAQIKGGLEVRNKGGLAMIIKNHRVSGSLKGLRDGLAHSGITLGEFAQEVDSLGLDSLVHYARAALMFEDASFRAIPNAHKPKAEKWNPATSTFALPGATDRRNLAKKYSGVDFGLDAGLRRRDCAIMGELSLSLLMLSGGLYRSATRMAAGAQHDQIRLIDHKNNIKYMTIDIHCFIEKFEKLKLRDAVTPDFIHRKGVYERLRHDCFAHTKVSKMRGTDAALEAHPGLLGDMLLDIAEVGALTDRLLEGFVAPPPETITPLTVEQNNKINQKLHGVQVGSHRRYGYGYVEHYDGSDGPEARERARRELG